MLKNHNTAVTNSIDRENNLTQKQSAKALITEGVIAYNRDINDEMIMFRAKAAKPLVCLQRKVSYVQRPHSSLLKPRSRLTTINQNPSLQQLFDGEH